MAVLVACLGEGKGTWVSVFKLASMSDWEKIFFVGPGFAKEHLTLKDNMFFVEINQDLPLEEQVNLVQKSIGDICFGEVGVSLFSGSGILHMVVLSALLRCGCGVKLVHFTDKFIEL
ncbi:hypothetical protein KY329_01440 [Candidatus Woesearchaeota archaeon]|nr:hypothetical protein [Candidatus Woesearchaeota archaeon]